MFVWKEKKSKFVTSVFDFLFVAARFTFEFCFLSMVYFWFSSGTTLAPCQKNASMSHEYDSHRAIHWHLAKKLPRWLDPHQAIYWHLANKLPRWLMSMIHEPLPNSLLWTPRCGTWCDKCEKQNPARLILFYFDHSKLKHLLRRRIPTQFNPHKPTPGYCPLITMILKAKFD